MSYCATATMTTRFSPKPFADYRVSAERPTTRPSSSVEDKDEYDLASFKDELFAALSEAYSCSVQDAAEFDFDRSLASIRGLADVLELLPEGFPLPSISFTFDGDLVLSWIRDPSWLLSGIVSGDKFSFSTYFRGQQIYGDLDISSTRAMEDFIGLAKRWLRGH